MTSAQQITAYFLNRVRRCACMGESSTTSMPVVPFAWDARKLKPRKLKRLSQVGLLLAIVTVGVMGSTAAIASAAPPVTFAPAGENAGQVSKPTGVAVNQLTGSIYVSDLGNFRVNKFDSTGHFLLGFGRGVATGSREEFQTCGPEATPPTATCAINREHNTMIDVAVDNSGGTSSGDVYLTGHYYVQKFSADGEFLLMFGKDVNQTTHGNICTAHNLKLENDVCGEGMPGNGPGEFAAATGVEPPVVVDNTGNVWVGDVERLEEFSPQGTFLSEVKLKGIGHVRTLALDSDPLSPSYGDFYTTTEGASEAVVKLGPTGVALQTLSGAHHPTALGIDPATGNLFVGDTLPSGLVSLLEYDSEGAQMESFGLGSVVGVPEGNALSVGDTAARLYVVGSKVGQTFTLPSPGPLLPDGSLATEHVRTTTATLKATLNPENAITSYHIEYIRQSVYEENIKNNREPFAGADSTTVESLAADFAYHMVGFSITGLAGETTYRYRLLAENGNGEGNVAASGANKSEEATFTTLPPALVDSESVSDVTSTSATLEASINALGISGEYHFDYLTEDSYQKNLHAGVDPFTNAIAIPIPDTAIAALEEDQDVFQHARDLNPATTYRYRVVVDNSGGITVGPDHVFRTQSPAEFSLLDGRGWELVSPPDKHGAGLLPIAETGLIQASATGDAIAYLATSPTESAGLGNANGVEVLSRRTVAGWASRDIATPHVIAPGASSGIGSEYRSFSPDLSLGVAEPLGVFDPSISLEASEQTPYLRTNFVGSDVEHACVESCYRPLVTGAPGFENVPSGTKFDPEVGTRNVIFVGGSPDLRHVAFQSAVALIEGVPAHSLYEWSDGQFSLVSVRPDGQPAPAASQVGLGSDVNGGNGGGVRNAVSGDGSRVVWAENVGENGGREKHLYLRDMVTEKTIELDAVQAGTGEGFVEPRFQFASSDDSRIFFTDTQRLTKDSGATPEKPDLYECEIVEVESELKCKLSDVTPLTGAGESAGVQGSVIGGSEDGSTVYFVADGVLATGEDGAGEKAVQGTCHSRGDSSVGEACNLYVDRNGTVGLVAVLSGGDSPDWARGQVGGFNTLTARVSPDGEWLAFMSQRPLTGYDNRDVTPGAYQQEEVKGELVPVLVDGKRVTPHDEEVFLYHAQSSASGELQAGHLVCASCNPTGARPHGIEYEHLNEGLAGGDRVWKSIVWLAANVPGWTPIRGSLALYQSRYLSDSGRLFFNSRDALVPRDTNRTEDVYEYEPAGVGDCSESKQTYVRVEGGCVELISSGTSVEESGFLDASENGNDVFFLTTAQLSKRDSDTTLDVYDAHVGGIEPEQARPVECQGDACQHPVSAPEDPTPGSLTYSGPGNVVIAPVPVVKGKAKRLTRAQKLANTLRACRKKQKRKRVVCERKARRVYGSKIARKTIAGSRRGVR